MDNYYWPQTQAQLHPWLPLSDAADYGCYFVPPLDGAAEDRAASASRSHNEAEKRRRDRINSQLATLRKLIPKSEKMDKAALLGQVVEHVKEEKERAKEAIKTETMPTEMDEVTINQLAAQDSKSQNIFIKASICCEDRPEFFTEFKSALKGIGATIVEAEVTSLGGRIKANFIVCAKEENSCTALKMVLSRLVVHSAGSSTYCTRSKRQRFFYPNSC